jgi:hypothetical protein
VIHCIRGSTALQSAAILPALPAEEQSTRPSAADAPDSHCILDCAVSPLASLAAFSKSFDRPPLFPVVKQYREPHKCVAVDTSPAPTQLRECATTSTANSVPQKTRGQHNRQRRRYERCDRVFTHTSEDALLYRSADIVQRATAPMGGGKTVIGHFTRVKVPVKL